MEINAECKVVDAPYSLERKLWDKLDPRSAKEPLLWFWPGNSQLPHLAAGNLCPAHTKAPVDITVIDHAEKPSEN